MHFNAKRILSLLLCLSLLAGGAALAEPVNATLYVRDQNASGYGRNVGSIASLGDTVYVLTDNTLESWKPGDAEPTVLVAELTNVQFASSDQAASSEAEKPGYGKLIADGTTLYGLNTSTGSLWKLVDGSGLLAAPVLAASLAWDNIHRKNEQEGYEYSPQIGDALILDGALYLTLQDWESDQPYELPSWDLATGKVIAENKGVCMRTLNAYTGGLIIGKLYDDMNSWDPKTETQKMPQLATFDPKTGKTEVLLDFPDSNTYGVRYDAAQNTLYYVQGATVYSLPGLQQPAKVSAYLPTRLWMDENVALLPGGVFVVADYSSMTVRQLDMPGIELGALTIFGEYGSSGHQAFLKAYPQANVTVYEDYFESLEDFTAAMVSGTNAIDVLRLNSQYTPISRLIDKGYAQDLSAYPELMAQIARMDTRLTAFATRDGKVFGMPVDLNANAIGYYKSAWKDVGLTQDDLPTTFVEFLDFVADWQANYAEDNPEYMITDDGSSRQTILSWLTDTYYAHQVREGGDVRFDTPLFRTLMEHFEAIDFTDMESDQEKEGDSYWSRKPLFSMYANATYPGQYRYDTQFLALPLDAGLEPVYSATADYMVINPRSTRLDQAVQYLTVYAQNGAAESAAITLFPDNNTALLDPNYEENVKGWKKYLEDSKASLETAPPDQVAGIKQDIEYMQDMVDHAEDYRYLVKEEDIARYRQDVAPYLVVIGQTPLSTWDNEGNNEFYSLREQYMQGALTLDAYIKEIDKRMRMIQLEDQ